ncbi:hypothetical protein CSOJ01_06833 [Colletotrichum sojae]|uniref:Uncharacterized protein n=1 Tax=Colletotrichum sojae TaxID=2175907 RepID=A0A8H6JAT3_9PEZI|nr:hypothetical protein CSOJ01_06833 [Colletotrichum sojae]
MRTNTEQSPLSTPLDEHDQVPPVPAEVDPCLPDDTSPQAVKRPSFTNRLFDGWWTLELVSMTLALAVFAIYLHLLRSYDGQLYDSWDENPLSTPFRNLQSAADFAVTLLRLFMLYPVTAAMDNNGHSISVGGILVIGTLYLGSSTQNTILIKSDSDYQAPSNVSVDHSARASLPFAHHYGEYMFYDDEGQDRNLNANRTMQAAVLTAWSYYEYPQYLGGRKASTLPVRCSTTSCRWDNVTTLAVVNTCESANASTSDGIGYSSQAGIKSLVNVTVSDGEPATKNAYLRLKTSRKVPDNSTFAGYDPDGVIVHLAAIARVGGDKHEAVECILQWKVREIQNITYDSTTRLLNETIFNRNDIVPTIATDEKGRSNITFSHAPCNFNNTGRCAYTVAWEAHVGLQNFLAQVLKGHVYQDSSRDNRVVRPDDVLTDLLALSFESKKTTDRLKATVNSYMTNVAIDIGNAIRTVSSSRKTKTGKVLMEAQYYEIDWNFVLYPGIMMFLSMYLFFSTVWRTRKSPAWKSSPLPLLYHGFERPVGEKESLPDLAWMKEASEKHKVVLRNDNDGLGLKLRGV